MTVSRFPTQYGIFGIHVRDRAGAAKTSSARVGIVSPGPTMGYISFPNQAGVLSWVRGLDESQCDASAH